MREQWNTTIVCHKHKKHDKAYCENYREIALLYIVYKVLAKPRSENM